jgi:hypothetical protein
MASTFKRNFAGYIQVMNYSGVQDLCKSKAQAVKEQADHMLSVGGYTAIDDHEVYDITKSDGRGASLVVTHTKHAMRSQNRKKTLEKALSAAKG